MNTQTKILVISLYGLAVFITGMGLACIIQKGLLHDLTIICTIEGIEKPEKTATKLIIWFSYLLGYVSLKFYVDMWTYLSKDDNIEK